MQSVDWESDRESKREVCSVGDGTTDQEMAAGLGKTTAEVGKEERKRTI
jgi:hypothetical protein